MKWAASQLYELIPVEDPDGFPLRALMAGIAEAEGGDPNAWVEHDPPTSKKGPPSSGLYQVNRGSYPAIYEATERVRLDASLSDEEKIAAMTELVKPIIRDMLRAALSATRTLASRGISVGLLETALFVDAAWQAGGGNLANWARTTRTGDPREIVNANRTVAVEVVLRNLAAKAMQSAPAILLALGVLGVFGFALFLLSKWET